MEFLSSFLRPFLLSVFSDKKILKINVDIFYIWFLVFLRAKGLIIVIIFPFLCRQLPTSLEELLEYQWDQGAQFLMQQASQYDGKNCIQERLTISEGVCHTAISRKVVGKNVHATIPKGNMGYDQHTDPDAVAAEPTFVAFL